MAVLEGDVHRVLAATFLHRNAKHLVGNVISILCDRSLARTRARREAHHPFCMSCVAWRVRCVTCRRGATSRSLERPEE